MEHGHDTVAPQEGYSDLRRTHVVVSGTDNDDTDAGSGLLNRPRSHLMLDFDGPVCAVLAGAGLPESFESALAAGSSALQAVGSQSGLRDPLALLRQAAVLGSPELVSEAEAVVVALEVRGAAVARLTPGVADLISRARRLSMSVCIVSNNSRAAVEAVAGRFPSVLGGLPLFCRPSHRPHLMKPDPFLLYEAMATLGAAAGNCLMVGDSESDVAACQAAGIAIIGYANKAGKHDRLIQAGADVVVRTLDEIRLPCATLTAEAGD